MVNSEESHKTTSVYPALEDQKCTRMIVTFCDSSATTDGDGEVDKGRAVQGGPRRPGQSSSLLADKSHPKDLRTASRHCNVNSASVVEMVVLLCFFDDQLTNLSPRNEH
ncbi:hypothetical protein Tco_1112318 [Tanacetum coccineum]|uniref:Uncharacterized protein n=1 Tax=Tanacetum coccineum TaxID=301880 RepID=A0ABQ5IP47_9ASTR